MPGAALAERPTLTLRPYQQDAIDAIAHHYLDLAGEEQVWRQLVVMGTGSGKTICLASLPTQPQIDAWMRTFPTNQRKILIIAHREELLDQTADKMLWANPDLNVTIEQGDRHADPTADVVIASVQTLSARNGRRMANLNVDDFRIVICDECFPAGTRVDGVPIETLRVGDVVTSFNHETGKQELRKIARTFERKVSGTLVRVTFADGRTLTCTGDHPIFTFEVGYVAAAALAGRHPMITDAGGGLHSVQAQSVEGLEPGSDGTFGGMCRNGYVYNLEVEGNNNYFAEGVLVHNCHHATAPTYRTVFENFDFIPPESFMPPERRLIDFREAIAFQRQRLRAWDEIAPRNRLLIGVTATARRGDNIGLEAVFQRVVFTRNIRDLIQDGYLCRVRGLRITSATCLDDVHTVAGDFNQSELERAINTGDRNKIAVKAYLEHAVGRQTVVFTSTVQHAKDMAEAFRAQNVRVEPVYGSMTPDERHGSMTRFRRKETNVVTNCALWTEGVDIPEIACIIHARPTKSSLLHVQMSGRGMRLAPGKEDCLIIDIIDTTRRHSLITTPSLFGLPVDFDVQGGDVLNIVQQIENARSANEYLNLDGVRNMEDVRIRAEEIDLFAITDEQIESFSTLAWIRYGEVYALGYPSQFGQETIELRQNALGQWDIINTRTNVQILAPEPDIASAFAAFEHWLQVKAPAVAYMKNRSATWRSQKPTEAQLAFLAQLGGHAKKDATKGEVSALIDVFIRRQKRLASFRRRT